MSKTTTLKLGNKMRTIYLDRIPPLVDMMSDTGRTLWIKENLEMLTEPRPLYVIAEDILKHWKNVNYAAAPYLDAMIQLRSIKDMYYADTARSVVLYFLSNAATWRGEDAKRIKAELKELLK